MPAEIDECGACHYWIGLDGIGSSYGRCRRYPPTRALDVAVGDGKHPVRLGMRQDHPETFRAAWCGEFKRTERQRPIQTGLDDGPPLPRRVVNAWKRERVMAEWKAGATLRDLAAKYEISHETVRVWTENDQRKVGASRRPHR